jgi:hypothetical protein
MMATTTQAAEQTSQKTDWRIFDLFHANTTNHTFDERTIRMNGWRLSKESFEIALLFDLLLQLGC